MEKSKNRKIDEEKVCIDCLINHLRSHSNLPSIIIESEIDDPPDFWLSINDVRYAAEVTSIVKNQGYKAFCGNLEQSIRKEAERLNFLKGNYILIIKGSPRIIGRKNEIVIQALHVISSSKTPQISNLFEDEFGSIEIKRSQEPGYGIGLLQSVGLKWEGEVREEIGILMKEAISKKEIKLKNKGIKEKIILLFYDAYGFGEIQDDRDAMKDIDGYEWLHSIFWASSFTDRPNELFPNEPGREGVFLYTKEKSWI